MGSSAIKLFKQFCAPLTALLVLSACNVTAEEPHRPPVRPDRPQMCTMEYAPVCGVRNGKTRTLGNSCQAGAEGYRIISKGECRVSQSQSLKWEQHPDRPGGAMRPFETSGAMRPVSPQAACTREYAPVCATGNGRSQTFANACVARNAGFDRFRNGACR